MHARARHISGSVIDRMYIWIYNTWCVFVHVRFKREDWFRRKHTSTHSLRLRWLDFLIWRWTMTCSLALIVNDYRYRLRLPLFLSPTILLTISIIYNRNFNEPLQNTINIFSKRLLIAERETEYTLQLSTVLIAYFFRLLTHLYVECAFVHIVKWTVLMSCIFC